VAQQARQLRFRRTSLAPDNEQRLDLKVVFTDEAKTCAALETASLLAGPLGAEITILAAQPVPYPRSITDPPVNIRHTQGTLLSLASHHDLDARVEIYLCRDRIETIREVLRPRSLVLLGMRSRFWPTWEQRLERALRRDGHHVIIANS